MRRIVVRALPDDVIEGLRQRARRNNRAMEAEVRELIKDAVFGEKRLMTRAEGIAAEAKEATALRDRRAAFIDTFSGPNAVRVAE